MKALKTILIMALAMLVLSVCVSAVTLDEIGDKEVNEGSELDFTISADDGTEPYDYEILSSTPALPSEATLDDETGEFSWTPDYDKADEYDVTFRVTDDDSNIAEETITITVENTPVNLEDPTNVEVDESELIEIELSAEHGVEDYTFEVVEVVRNTPLEEDEPEEGDTKTDIIGKYFLDDNVFKWIPDYTQAGTYTVTFQVEDSSSPEEFDEEEVSITVNDLQPLSMTENVLLGGSSQFRSNPEAPEDSGRREVYTQTTFTVTNNGDLPVDLKSLTTDSNSKYDDYELEILNFVEVELAPSGEEGDSIDFTVKGYVPKDLPSFFPGRDDYNDRKNELGELKLTSTTEGISSTFTDLYIQAENQLEFKSLYVWVGNDDTKIRDDNKRISDINLGDEIKVETKAENTYSDSDDDEDLEIEGIEFSVFIDQEDFEVEEDTDMDDLDADEISDEESIEFEIDWEDAEATTYDMYVMVFGEDENGAVMGEKYTVELRVEKEDHNIGIFDIDLTPKTAICKNSAELKFTLVNIGDSNENEVAYKLENTALNLDERDYDIRLDEGDEYTKRFSIPLEGVKSGDYFIEIISYYEDNEFSNSETATLHVEACPVIEEEEEEEEEEVVLTPEAGLDSITGSVTGQPPVTVIPELESFNEFQNTSIYMMLLGGLVVVLTIVLILMLIKFVF